ncbi:MAG TPA: fibronectin type III domain-containing protein [Acidimicrobiales bacterium]|nr:fibronectin type III domain-containing protein [Acidimicrobiales bacterium]
MGQRARRRIAIGAAVAGLVATFVAFVPSAYAVAITQNPPTSGSVTANNSAGFSQQLSATGGTGTFTWGPLTSGAPLFTISSTGLLATTGTLSSSPIPYTATGIISDGIPADQGTFTFSLTVTGGMITQTSPTTASILPDQSTSFSSQITQTGGIGTVTFAKTGGSSQLLVSNSGRISTTGFLTAGIYSASGNMTDASGDSGTFTFTLTVQAPNLPGAPTSVTAQGQYQQVTVHWSPPASDGGSPITGYVVTPSAGTPVTVGNVTKAVVSGLTNGVSYTFQVAAINAAGTGPNSASSSPVSPFAAGYWLVASDGGIFTFGPNQPFFGSTGGTPLNRPIVGMAVTPDGGGYWLVASDGGVFSFGDAAFYGSEGGQPLNQPIVGIASTPSGLGYWLVAADGGVFTFGDAPYLGSEGGQPLSTPIVGMGVSTSGLGYWLVGSDGAVYPFGDAGNSGSEAGQPLSQPVVGMGVTVDGNGYWMVARDGGIFSFGDAGFHGSAGGTVLNQPIIGMSVSPDSFGYWLAASDGGIFTYGSASFNGSFGGDPPPSPVVAVATN